MICGVSEWGMLLYEVQETESGPVCPALDDAVLVSIEFTEESAAQAALLRGDQRLDRRIYVPADHVAYMIARGYSVVDPEPDWLTFAPDTEA